MEASEGPMHSSPHCYYVYIMTNRSKTLYTGVTGNLERRVFEHKQGVKGEFAACYKIDRLAYFERFGDVRAGNCAGKADQGVAASQEDKADRLNESGMEGS
jgi:predicted GIY-YIG superfamily endonuclease